MSRQSHENLDPLTTRSIAIVLVVMTILFCICWVTMGVPQLQAAAFISGLISVVTWLSYFQQKTSASIERIKTGAK